MTTRSTSRAFTLLLKRDLTLAFRQRSEMINPLHWSLLCFRWVLAQTRHY